MLSLTVLGCSGSYPQPASACSGYLFSDGTTRLWADAGSGTMANLQVHIDLGDLDALFLSHAHPDHWGDVEGLHVALRYFLDRRDFPVYAPAGLSAITSTDTSPCLAWHEVGDGDALEVGTLRLSFSRTDHGPETLALRVDAAAGGSIGYSADTGPGWSLSSLGPGLDLALCEASLPIDKEGSMQHLSARQAGATARAAGAERLVLTHFGPGLDRARAAVEAAAEFGRPVELAAVGSTFVVGG